MQQSTTWFALAAAALLALFATTKETIAQAPVQPEPGPPPALLINPYPPPPLSFYTAPPVYLMRPTAYSFNGPSPATIGYVVSTTTYYQFAGDSRLMATTTYMPVFGYQPGYYSGYVKSQSLYFRP